MSTYFTAQGTLLSALWWPKWEGNLKKSGYMYMYDGFTLLHQQNLAHCKANYTPIKINFKKGTRRKKKKERSITDRMMTIGRVQRCTRDVCMTVKVSKKFLPFPKQTFRERTFPSSSEVKVSQSCPTLWNPMDYTIHAILQPRIQE